MKQPVRAALQDAVPRGPLTMQHLRRMELWGATAAFALFLAVLATRSDFGSQRIAALFSGQPRTLAAERAFDAQAETRRLADAVRALAAENADLRARLAAIEQNVNDMTGSVTKQIEEVKKQAASAWPAQAQPDSITPAIISSIISPVQGPSAFGVPLPSPPQTSAATPSPSIEPTSTAALTKYGVDVGSSASIDMLRARWLGIRSAHRHLFAGLTPTVVLRPIAKSSHVELHLVVGPLDSSEAAAELCAALEPYRLICQPVEFDSQHIALR